MKHYINLTSKVTIQHLLTMLKELFNEYKYIRFNKKTGIVTFRTSFWSKRDSYASHIFELCIEEIPKRIIQYRTKSIGYAPIYNTLSETIIRLKDRIDIVEHLWREYLKIKYPLIIKNASKNTLRESRVITVYQTYYDIPGSYIRGSTVAIKGIVRNGVIKPTAFSTNPFKALYNKIASLFHPKVKQGIFV